MITLDALCDHLSRRVKLSAVIKSEDLVVAASQLLAGLLSGRDIYFFDDGEEHYFTPSVCPSAEVSDRIYNSTSVLHLHTSGTTGEPKLVSHPVMSLLQGVRTGRGLDHAVWGFAYSCLHISGVLVLLQAWVTGASVVDLRNLSRKALAKQIEATGVTHISAPTTFYRMALPLDKVCRSVVSVTNGGEPLDLASITDIQSSFPHAVIKNVYASTEFGSLLVSDGIGFSIPDRLVDQVRIEDGKIMVHRFRLATNVVFDGEWYDTGDVISWIDGDQFSIIGRAGEQVKVLGHLVSLSRIEEVITSLPDVGLCRVCATRHKVFGHLLTAEVVLADGSEVTKQDIKLSLGGMLRDYEVPARIKIVDAIETTYSGKLARN